MDRSEGGRDRYRDRAEDRSGRGREGNHFPLGEVSGRVGEEELRVGETQGGVVDLNLVDETLEASRGRRGIEAADDELRRGGHDRAALCVADGLAVKIELQIPEPIGGEDGLVPCTVIDGRGGGRECAQTAVSGESPSPYRSPRSREGSSRFRTTDDGGRPKEPRK